MAIRFCRRLRIIFHDVTHAPITHLGSITLPVESLPDSFIKWIKQLLPGHLDSLKRGPVSPPIAGEKPRTEGVKRKHRKKVNGSGKGVKRGN